MSPAYAIVPSSILLFACCPLSPCWLLPRAGLHTTLMRACFSQRDVMRGDRCTDFKFLLGSDLASHTLVTGDGKSMIHIAARTPEGEASRPDPNPIQRLKQPLQIRERENTGRYYKPLGRGHCLLHSIITAVAASLERRR